MSTIEEMERFLIFQEIDLPKKPNLNNINISVDMFSSEYYDELRKSYEIKIQKLFYSNIKKI
tara:strand:- start:23946 stop:24131 length:186 start_codon:yes stop_codon:yes gene_type:complete